jgi:hypothetical protein
VVSVFYTSNVEMYLFQDATHWRDFYENVATLPRNRNSSFVRFVVNRMAFSRSYRESPQMWSSVEEVIRGVEDGTIRSYGGLVNASR